MLERLRCKKCGKTLLFHEVKEGVVEIKCWRQGCKVLNTLICDDGVCTLDVSVDGFAQAMQHVV